MKNITKIPTKKTISATSINYDSPDFSLVNSGDKVILISELSLGFDSNFTSNGSVDLVIAGIKVSDTPFEPIGNITFDYSGEKDLCYLPPNEKLQVYYKVTSGSGVVQYSVKGVEYSLSEWDLILKKHFGKASWLDELKIMLFNIFKGGR